MQLRDHARYIILLMMTRWLVKNSLSALHLTLMDAFGPATIPHSSKHVPLLGKDVSSKVFASLFPLAHVAHGNEVTLIHPNGVDLKQYEKNLEEQIEKYWNRLSRLAWSAIPEEKCSSLEEELSKEEGVESKGGVWSKEGVESSEDGESEERVKSDTPSYKEHRAKLRQALADSGWSRSREDFDLLEKEIGLGKNFRKYLKALKIEAEKSGSISRQSDFYDCQWSDEGRHVAARL